MDLDATGFVYYQLHTHPQDTYVKKLILHTYMFNKLRILLYSWERYLVPRAISKCIKCTVLVTHSIFKWLLCWFIEVRKQPRE